MANANRLAQERSPYLLQHAHNPVDWYPWGEEAFERARRENKPVFLSIGYSACHWCHVMERESFEDEETAKFLAEHFVSIKVDREERPDIDQIYQLAHQVLTQRAGGWPLSTFLAPDKKPFYAGTYFPNVRRYGMPSFRDLLAAIHDAFANRRGEVDEQAAELTRVVMNVSSTAPATRGRIDADALADAKTAILRRAEPNYGGFGRAPKFPNTMTLDLLLMAGTRSDDARARDHYFLTVDRMARGGIYDQLGGGFARYSTDEKWLIPHFEKMLYDNAQLARVYTDAWRARSRWPGGDAEPALCERIVRETLTYVLREMTDPVAGTFFSAQDADSEGEEGKFFVWTPSDVEAVIGADDARIVCAAFDVTTEGNFEHGKSALWLPRGIDELAASLGIAAAEVRAVLDRARPKLFAAREQRVKPMRDDKCLAAWNATMISAFVEAGATFGERSWIDAGVRALAAWRERGFANGRLAHAMKDGVAYGTGYLDDYAGLSCAAIDVYEATFDPTALAFARALVDTAIDLFRDDADDGFYYSPRDGEVVIQRTREVHDHAYPGGYGLIADALLRMGEITGIERYRSAGEKLLEGVATMARENPLGLGTVARAVDRAARGSTEIVVIGDPASADAKALLDAIRSVYVPHRVIVCVTDESQAGEHGIDRALVASRTRSASGAARAYVCRGTVCDAPVESVAELKASLERA